MANRYWVGGTGTWNDTAKWSASSGGASGASVPTDSDDVFFDANSDTGTSFTVSLPSSSQQCRDFTALSLDAPMLLSFTAGGGNLLVYGNWSNPSSLFSVSGPSVTGDGHLRFVGVPVVASEPDIQILTNSVLFPMMIIGGDDGGGPSMRYWRLASTLNVTYLSFGEFGFLNTTGYTINAGNILTKYVTSSSTSIFELYFQLSTINVSGNLQVPSTGGCDLEGNIINMTGSSSKLLGSVTRTTGIRVNQLNFTSTLSGEREISGAFYFQEFVLVGYTQIITFATPTQRNCVLYIHDLGGTGSLGEVFNLSGTSQFRYLIKGKSSIKSLETNGSRFKPNSPSISYADFFAINCINASPLVGTSLGDIGNNTNITFQAARNVYWNQAAGGNWTDNAWALSAGGGVSYDYYPLPQDTVYIVDTGLNSSATITIFNDPASEVIPKINGLARTIPATISIGSEVRFIGNSYVASSFLVFSSTSSSYPLYLSPVTNALTIDIAGTISDLKLASSWTYASGTSSFILNRNLTVTNRIDILSGILFFNTYTIFCAYFSFLPDATYTIGLNFTGGGLIKIAGTSLSSFVGTAFFYNAASSSVLPEIISTSYIEVGAAGDTTTVYLPDSTNSLLSKYGRKLNIKPITSNSFTIVGNSSTSNVETNVMQVGKLDFSSYVGLVTLGLTAGYTSIAIYRDFILGASTSFNSRNPASNYKLRQYWVMSADADSPPSTTITTNGNTSNFGQYSALVFDAGSMGTSHEFILGDDLTVYGSAARTDVSSAVALASGKLNLNGKILSAVNFIIGPYYYVRWLNSTVVATWQDIYQKQLVFNGGSITVRGTRSSASQSGGTPSTWNTFGWECVSSPSLVSIENGTSAGTINLKPYGDGFGYDTEFRGGCTTSNSTASAPSATPISYPCIVQNVPVSATNLFASVIISGNTLFNNTLTTQTPSLYPSFVFNPTAVIVLNGDFTMVGGSTTKGKLTSTTTTPANITKNGTNVDPTNIKVSYTNVNPTGKWIGRQSYGVENLGNNTGWIFTTTVTNNNISESTALSGIPSPLVFITVSESIGLSESYKQLQYANINENMVAYQYFVGNVDYYWTDIDTDSPSLPDWDSNNSI